MTVSEPQLTMLCERAEHGVSLDGLCVSVGAEGYAFSTPEERHTGLDETELASVAAEHSRYVMNWYHWAQSDHTESERAYLRWLEHAAQLGVPERYETLKNGLARAWGELDITTTLADGKRRYAICHEADIEREDLQRYDDPLSAREIAKYDDGGRYRPLKTAPTLQTGWEFAGLSGREALRTIDFFYPATVQNWHLEREGELDVSHWRETAQRQTGIYELVDEFEELEWLTEACCVDSQCLKRREWDESDAEPIGVARGDGEFPCREPCSVVIAAARKWTLLEREQTQQYTLELTPSEKQQLETIIDAVAEGRVDDIREADTSDGANRYRARFLRAKRMENGRLCGGETGE